MAGTKDTNAQVLGETTRKTFSTYEKLSADDKLSLLYFIYEDMGEEVTPAAPTAAEPNLAPMLLGDFYSLSEDEQLAVMRQIVNCEDTAYSRAYGALTPNNQLVVWFAWAQGMGDTVVDLPDNYEAAENIGNLLGEIEALDFQEQISLLREMANQMGYSEIKAPPSQSETGKTASL